MAIQPLTLTKAVASAGTAVAIGTRPAIGTCIIQADTGNTRKVFIGDSSVETSTGISLDPGDSMSLQGPQGRGWTDEYNLSDIFVDAANSADLIRIMAFVKKP